MWRSFLGGGNPHYRHVRNDVDEGGVGHARISAARALHPENGIQESYRMFSILYSGASTVTVLLNHVILR
jgi:hypothetical protein